MQREPYTPQADPYQLVFPDSNMMERPYKTWEPIGLTWILWTQDQRRSICRICAFMPSVSVVGDFSHWDGRTHPMGASGEGICAAVHSGYQLDRAISSKFIPNKAIHTTQDGSLWFYIDQFPSFASRVFDHERYVWGDDAWRQRPKPDLLRSPLISTKVHLGSWRWRDGRYDLYANWRRRWLPM